MNTTTEITEANHRANSTTNYQRALIMLMAGLLPPVLAILLSGLFFIAGDYPITTPVPARTDLAAIEYPQANIPVSTTFTAKGTLSALAENTLAYLMVKRGEFYWPKKYLGSIPGSWSVTIKEPKRADSELSLVILQMSPAGKTEIDQWYATARKTGKYPGLININAAQEIAAIKVKQQ